MLKNKINAVNNQYHKFINSIKSIESRKIKELKHIINCNSYNNAISSLQEQFNKEQLSDKFLKNNLESYIDHSFRLIDYIENLIKEKSHMTLDHIHLKQINLKCAKVKQYIRII